MATSNTVTWRPEVEEIITEAFERCLLHPTKIDRHYLTTARRSLNLLFAEWATRGINYWKTAETTLDMVASTASYALPAGTLDVLHAVLRRSSSDIEMQRISLTEYNALPNKTSEGLPINFFFDRQYTPQIYVWPVPENSTDDIIYWRFEQMDDVTLSQQDADVPYRWNDAICAGLAAKLSIKIPGIPPDRIMMLDALAAKAFQFASDDEGEKVSLKIFPAPTI